MAPSHVLVPMDGSPLAEEALAHALDVFDCRVTVLNVVTPLDAGFSESGVLDVDDGRTTSARERATAFVEEVREEVAATDREVETAVEVGDPADAILAYAEAHDVDQIVLGGHGGDAGSVRRRLLGTVSTAVVGESPIPVTVVK